MSININREIYVRKARTPSFGEPSFNYHEAQNIPILRSVQEALDDGTLTAPTGGAGVLTDLQVTGTTLTLSNPLTPGNSVDLSIYLDDTNLARLTSGVLDVNGIATFTRDDLTTFTVDMSSLTGQDSSYATANLIADDNRAHDWGTFNLNENFTTGVQVRTYDNSSSIGTFEEQPSFFNYRVSNGIENSGILALPLFVQLVAENATAGTVNQFILRDDETIFQGDVPFVFGNVPGVAGQVLTSYGAAGTPLWEDIPAIIPTLDFYDNDANAGVAGVAIGGWYLLTPLNNYGLPEGMVKQRVN